MILTKGHNEGETPQVHRPPASPARSFPVLRVRPGEEALARNPESLHGVSACPHCWVSTYSRPAPAAGAEPGTAGSRAPGLTGELIWAWTAAWLGQSSTCLLPSPVSLKPMRDTVPKSWRQTCKLLLVKTALRPAGGPCLLRCLWTFLGVSMILLGTSQGPGRWAGKGRGCDCYQFLHFHSGPLSYPFSKTQPEGPLI